MGLLKLLTLGVILVRALSGITASHERERRMIGGRAARIEDWTFTASLVFLQPRRMWQICTATVINRLWLVTAAHCVHDIKSNPDYLQVKIYSKQTASKTKIYGVQHIRTHPSYLSGFKEWIKYLVYTWDYDVALLKLNETISDDVAIVPMAEKEVAVNGCRSAGWGSLSPLKRESDVKDKKYNISKSLQEIQVPLVPWEACYDFRTGNHKIFALINTHVLCGGATSFSYQQGGCIGDSGSPLICNSSEGKVLHGVLLGGNPLCNQGKDFMIFAQIAAYKWWIDKTIQLHSP